MLYQCVLVYVCAKQLKYLSITKVEVNSLGVADVEDAIRFRREPSPNLQKNKHAHKKRNNKNKLQFNIFFIYYFLYPVSYKHTPVLRCIQGAVSAGSWCSM